MPIEGPSPEVSHTGPPLLMSAWNFPPDSGGTAILLFDLLQHFPLGAVVAVSGATYSAQESGLRLPISRRRALVLGSRWLTPRVATRAPLAYARWVARKICASARREGAQVICAHYPNSVFAIGAYLASERLGLPLTVYFDILWEERGDNAALARRYEGVIVRRATRRFAITEYAVEHLERKHGVRFTLMPHVRELAGALRYEERKERGSPLVHFAGGIYPRMNQDALVRLGRVLEGADRDIWLEIYSATGAAELEAAGVPMRRVRCGFVPRSELAGVQRASDVLYLPQAFRSPHPEMIRCNFPTKALEYMAAGRPILVHSPPGSYLADVARQHGFGLVVDRDDDGALAEGLERLLADETLARRLVAGGFAFLRSREARAWSQRYYQALAQAAAGG